MESRLDPASLFDSASTAHALYGYLTTPDDYLAFTNDPVW